MDEKYSICRVTRGTNVKKNRIISPQIIASVRSALRGLGKDHLLILIRQNRSTSGLPIMEKTPETNI
jgi:hypothetical protein